MRVSLFSLRCDIPSEVREYVRITSWLHEEGTSIEIFPEKEPRGKYTLLDQSGGHLLVHHTSTYDTYKKYTCKTENKLTGLRRRSIEPARLTLTGTRNNRSSQDIITIKKSSTSAVCI